MSTDPPPFRVHAADDGGRATVSFAAGTELTERNADELHGALTALAARAAPHLTVDLTGVTMLTSIVLSNLFALQRQLVAGGGRLTLLNPAPLIHSVFKVAKLDGAFDIRPGPG